MPENWDALAETRRRQIEEGSDITFCKVMLPYFTSIARRRPFKRILEVGAGTGHLSKSLASNENEVVAIEPSDGMHKIASSTISGSSVKLLKLKAEELGTLGQFDLILSHLCLQTVAEPLRFLSSITGALSPAEGSTFVCSIPHPCFYNDYKHFFSEKSYSYMSPSFKKIDLTITKEPDTPLKSIPYYHRPLSVYFELFRDAGLIVAGFDEIFPSEEIQALYGALWDTPRYCAFHLIGSSHAN